MVAQVVEQVVTLVFQEQGPQAKAITVVRVQPLETVVVVAREHPVEMVTQLTARLPLELVELGSQAALLEFLLSTQEVEEPLETQEMLAVLVALVV